MAAVTGPTSGPSAEIRPLDVPGVAWIAVIIGVFLAYVLLQENGALLSTGWETLHELTHDARHAIGVPCH